MKNTNFAPEMYQANEFIIKHNNDAELKDFIYMMQYETDGWLHSDRWSAIYDWMKEHYPEATGSLITGICYFCEG